MIWYDVEKSLIHQAPSVTRQRLLVELIIIPYYRDRASRLEHKRWWAIFMLSRLSVPQSLLRPTYTVRKITPLASCDGAVITRALYTLIRKVPEVQGMHVLLYWTQTLVHIQADKYR